MCGPSHRVELRTSFVGDGRRLRTTYAARTGLPAALEVAFSGGAVMGMSVVGLAVIGLGGL